MESSGISRRNMLAAASIGALGTAVAAKAASVEYPNADNGKKKPEKRQNIILFVTDELRADALACYGNQITKTPNFDRLANEGTRFENCHVQFPVCGASRCSFLTGWPTSVRGHRSLYYYLRPDEPNLFRYLKNSGYDVYWFGKNDALAQETFHDSVTYWKASNLSQLHQLNSVHPGIMDLLKEPYKDRKQNNDYTIIQEAIKVLEERKADKPFCLFLPMFNPHPPYTCSEDFYNMYDPNKIKLLPRGTTKRPGYHDAIRKEYHLDKLSDADLRKLRAVYYGQVSFSDWLLGELMGAMKKTGHDKDTALFAFSDHGDYAGDYGLIEKWPSGLEDCLTHVPMIAKIPGGKKGHVSKEMTEVYDVMQSCLEIAGVEADHTHFSRSLLPQMHGKPGDKNRAAFTEGGYNTYEPQIFEPVRKGLYFHKTNLQNQQPQTISRAVSVRTQTHKLVLRPNGVSELYDCQKDPDLLHNLYGHSSMASVQAQLQTRITNWYINTTGIAPMDKDPRGCPPCMPPPNFRQKARDLLDH